MTQKDGFLHDKNKPSRMHLDGFGDVDVEHPRQYPHLLHQAFDLRMRMIAYWKIVLRRLVDVMALQLQYSVFNLVNNDLEAEIVTELITPHGGGIERLMESPSVATKHLKLNGSVKKLQECKKVLAITSWTVLLLMEIRKLSFLSTFKDLVEFSCVFSCVCFSHLSCLFCVSGKGCFYLHDQ